MLKILSTRRSWSTNKNGFIYHMVWTARSAVAFYCWFPAAQAYGRAEISISISRHGFTLSFSTVSASRPQTFAKYGPKFLRSLVYWPSTRSRAIKRYKTLVYALFASLLFQEIWPFTAYQSIQATYRYFDYDSDLIASCKEGLLDQWIIFLSDIFLRQAHSL